MFSELGPIFLVLALACSVWAVVAAFTGSSRKSSELVLSSKNATIAASIFLTIAMLALVQALLASDFRYEYVASYTSRALPGFYKFTALWAGQAGSLMLWAWILMLYTLAVLFTFRNRMTRIIPYVIGILMVIAVFFVALVVFAAKPFAMLPAIPPDGHGLNPLLQHWAMIIHPPILYLGYVGFAVPFAFAIAALLSGEVGNEWVKNIRRWTLVPWFFLGIGMLLGGKWAYMELGWGGYWAWDPVENAAFMPWLTGTAFLHSIIIQEKKDMLKIWNMVLVILTFTLSIFGTFLTRSGVISSVHSFSASSVGPLFLAFVFLILIASFGILFMRSYLLKSEVRIESMVSREAAFLVNNVIFVGACFAVFWGTIFPVVTEAVRGVKITVGPPFFNSVNTPIFLFLLFLTGVGPLVAWRKSSIQHLKKQFLQPLLAGVIGAALLWFLGIRHVYALISFALSIFVTATIVSEFHRGARARMKTKGENYFTASINLIRRNQRRYGGYIVHFAIVLIFIGVTGTAFDQEYELSLNEGESYTAGHYEVTYKGYRSTQDKHRQVLETVLDLRRDGKFIKQIYPQRHFYFAQEQPTTEISAYSTLAEDFYVVFIGIDEKTMAASFKFYLKPLVTWIWIGGMVLTIGTVICLVPSEPSRKKPNTERQKTTGSKKQSVTA